MADREKVIKASEIFRDSNPYKLCSGREFRAIREPKYCMGQMIEDTIAMLKEQGVKHGEWISIWREDDPDTSTDARCSVCNRVSKRPAGEYCKWCGAKMDLEGR